MNEATGLQYGTVTTNGKDLFFFYRKLIARLSPDGSFKAKYFPNEIICATGGENIWLGFMKHGAVSLDTDLNEVYTEPLLKDKSVTSIRSDYEGGVWFSTLEKGIFYLKNPHITHLLGDSTLAGPVFRLYDPGDNSMLYANTTGIYQMIGNTVSRVLHQNATKITDLFIDQNKNIYLAGSPDFEGNASIVYKKSTDIHFNNVFILTAYAELITPMKNKYVRSVYDGLYLYTLGPDLKPQKKSMEILCDSMMLTLNPGVLLFDKKKQMWMGTITGLYKINSLNSPPVQFKPYDTLFQKGITAIRQMENGIYCVGIRFGGIALMKDTNIIAKITETEGLVSNSIKYLLILKDQLWVATAKGISVIRLRSFNPVKYTVTNIGR
ncbi:MAG: hypothetical protein ABIN74_06495, partial [Ferruginibacter sp.]